MRLGPACHVGPGTVIRRNVHRGIGSVAGSVIIIMIIIMEICKAPTLPLEAPNKRSIAHIMYIGMEVLSAIMYKKRQEKANT